MPNRAKWSALRSKRSPRLQLLICVAGVLIGTSCRQPVVTMPSDKSEDAGTKPLKLDNTPINALPTNPDVNAKHYLTGAVSYQWNLQGVVGHAIYVAKQHGQCPDTEKTTYSMLHLDADSYVEDPTKLTVLDKLGPPIYDSRIDKGADVSLSILLFSGGAHQQDFAEVSLTNASTLPNTGGLVKDYAKKIQDKLTDDDCFAMIVTGATVQLLSTRWFKHISGNGTISGPTFGVNGKLYNNQDQSENKILIAIDYSLVRKPGGVTLAPEPVTVPRFLMLQSIAREPELRTR